MQRLLQTKRFHALFRIKSVRYQSEVAASTSRVMDIASSFNENSEDLITSVPKASWATTANALRPRDFVHDKTPLHALELEKLGSHEGYSMMPDEEEVLLKDMSPMEVDKWLESYSIPYSAFLNGKDEEQVRKAYARQLRLECSVHDLAKERYRKQRCHITSKLGRGSDLKSSKSLMDDWFMPLTEAIRLEQKNLLKNSHEDVADRNLCGPALLLLKPETLAVLTINDVLNKTLSGAEGVSFVKIASKLGVSVQQELKYQQEQHDPAKLWLRVAQVVPNQRILNKSKQYFETVGNWDKRALLKIGAFLSEMLLSTCKVPNTGSDGPSKIPAFEHVYFQMDKRRRVGMLKCSAPVYSYIIDGNGSSRFLPWTARFLPMLVPPRPWTDISTGGYLRLQSSVMRHRDGEFQMKCLKQGKLDDLYQALNSMSRVPWKINDKVYHVMKKVWAAGGGFGDLPSRSNLPLPSTENFDMDVQEDVDAYNRLVRKVEKQNKELHSLRCDTVYKLQVAEEFLNEEELYFPYNIDFRGRVYPIPPNLNHLGSDISRSLLIFKEAKPLGKEGLRWLKIHLANLLGVNKISFSEREEYINEHMNLVLDSANDPLGGQRWWQEAEYPFLALGVCFDLAAAMQCANPEEYASCIPVHQDGSCNGLQHYAALGRDSDGAFHVNLTESSRPQDVYTGVADRVVEKMREDAEMEVGEEVGKPEFPVDLQKIAQAEQTLAATERFNEAVEEYREQVAAYKKYQDRVFSQDNARFVLDHITRKVVKQTVMTSVYGVTYIGARKQIQARLEESLLAKSSSLESDWEKKVYSASCYAARVTMDSMANLFTAARDIMDWLAQCATIVAKQGQPMGWVTPMGIPVVQPYRRQGTLQIKTRVQHVVVSIADTLPVSAQRQRTAFPPNYVHSLDSTHMLLTALACEKQNVSFAAVHDSFWTHAGTVDAMNACLRDEFVHLYDDNTLLEDLHRQLSLRFPSCEFPPVPQKGEFDVKNVLKSLYFFN